MLSGRSRRRPLIFSTGERTRNSGRGKVEVFFAISGTEIGRCATQKSVNSELWTAIGAWRLSGLGGLNCGR